MIIFVGDKPSAKMKPGAKPFEGAACEKRLYEWIYGLVGSMLGVTRFEIVNQCDFSYKELLAKYYAYKPTFIALGNVASKKLDPIPHFKLPHPSGRNRQINDKTFIENKLMECREWLKK